MINLFNIGFTQKTAEEFLKEKGCSPFAQPYRDFETNKEPNFELKRFARWVNHKAIFKSVEFKNYKAWKYLLFAAFVVLRKSTEQN